MLTDVFGPFDMLTYVQYTVLYTLALCKNMGHVIHFREIAL
jgi:hypothetical protein